MLYFVKAELRELPPMPREQWLGMVAATWEILAQLERSGKARGVGAIIGKQAGVAVLDLESHDELAELMQRLPIFAFLTWEVAPLTSAERALDSARWATAALARREEVGSRN